MAGLVASDGGLLLPDFVRPISSREARQQRWRHNLISWLSIPLRILGRRAPIDSFGILMYHRISPLPQRLFPPTYNVTPHAFRRQLTWLINHGYQPWRLDRLVAARIAGEAIPPKVFAVTFDDGYANNLTHALPILSDLGVPATIFLATAYIDSANPFPFDNWISGEAARVPDECWRALTLRECHQLLKSDLIDFGCHTHTHADFRDNPGEFEVDVARSMKFLAKEFGVTRPAFSYPFGVPQLGFADSRLAEVVQRLGCSCGLQIGNSLVERQAGLFQWPRFDIAPAATGRSIAGKLDGWSEGVRALWHKVSWGNR